MKLEIWLLFAFAITVASISPGPNVLIVIVNAVKFGRRGAVWTILGNLTCLFGVALLAAFGVGAVIETAPTAYFIMKIAGGAYLAWLGFKIVRGSFGAIQEMQIETAVKEPSHAKRTTLFLEAIAVSASNPKSILFLTAIFPQFLDTTAAIPLQFAIMFGTIIGIVSIIHGFYAFLAISVGQKPISVSIRRWFSRVTGTTFIGLGAGVAFSK